VRGLTGFAEPPRIGLTDPEAIPTRRTRSLVQRITKEGCLEKAPLFPWTPGASEDTWLELYSSAYPQSTQLS